MRSSNLLSKEWCDLIFENRNKEYGAYRLRRQAGARYRCALLVVVGAFAALVLFYWGLEAYSRYLNKQDLEEAEKTLNSLITSDLKEGYKIRILSTARVAPSVRMTKGTAQGPPVIVDGNPPVKTFGTKGAIQFDANQELIITPVIEQTEPQDTLLPVVKQKIIETQSDPKMPEFPGGARAFMKWLDENISYPRHCVKKRKEGVIIISFIVGPDGYPTDFKVEDAFDVQIYNAAINALKRMPKWEPGIGDDGRPTPVMISVPVEFKL